MSCLASEVAHYKRIAADISDPELISNMKKWREFKVPLRNNTNPPVWRRYCRIMREEAHRRGLSVPAPEAGA